jgi:hypothetical protein
LQRRQEEAQKAIPTDISLAEMDSPPDFDDCPHGYWVIRPKIDPTREGYIEKIRHKDRILFVNFNQGDGNIFLTPVPYDEPHLLWFREVPLSQAEPPEPSESPHNLNLDDPVDLVRVDPKPKLSETPGLWFIRGANQEIQYFVDHAEDESTRTHLLSTRYRNKEGHVVAQQISYDEKDLFWYREKVLSISEHSNDSGEHSNASGEESVMVLEEPPPIGKATGHWVSVSEESANGLVDRVNLTTRRMVVTYEDGNHEISYDQPGLIWMK